MRYGPLLVFGLATATLALASGRLAWEARWQPASNWRFENIEMPVPYVHHLSVPTDYRTLPSNRLTTTTTHNLLSRTRWVGAAWRADGEEVTSSEGHGAPPSLSAVFATLHPVRSGDAQGGAVWIEAQRIWHPESTPRMRWTYRVREEFCERRGLFGRPYLLRRLHAVRIGQGLLQVDLRRR